LNSEKIWKIQKIRKLKSENILENQEENIGKIWKKDNLNR
jgi:hypothetical protein